MFNHPKTIFKIQKKSYNTKLFTPITCTALNTQLNLFKIVYIYELKHVHFRLSVSSDFIWGYYLPFSTFSEKSQLLFSGEAEQMLVAHTFEKNLRFEKKLEDNSELKEKYVWWNSLVIKTQIFWEIWDLRESVLVAQGLELYFTVIWLNI